MKKKIIQFKLQTKNRVNMLVNPIEIPVTTKNRLIPLLSLNYFKKKGKKDD